MILTIKNVRNEGVPMYTPFWDTPKYGYTYIYIISQYYPNMCWWSGEVITTHRLHALPNHSPWSCGPCSAVIQLRVSDHDFVPSHIESAHLAAIPLTTTRDLHITYTVINVNHCQSQINDNLSATLGGYHFGSQFSLFSVIPFIHQPVFRFA